MSDILKERADCVENAYRLLQGNKDSLGNIPGVLRQIISLQAWEGYSWRGKTISFSSFREFVETPLPEGLGTTIEDLVSLCRRYPEIADLIDQVVQEQMPAYRPPKNKAGINKKRPSGTSFQRALRKLRGLAAENDEARRLREDVLSGKLSANSALRELGHRKVRYTIEPTPQSIANFVRKRLSPQQVQELKNLLD